jgi:hypothetical protein
LILLSQSSATPYMRLYNADPTDYDDGPGNANQRYGQAFWLGWTDTTAWEYRGAPLVGNTQYAFATIDGTLANDYAMGRLDYLTSSLDTGPSAVAYWLATDVGVDHHARVGVVIDQYTTAGKPVVAMTSTNEVFMVNQTGAANNRIWTYPSTSPSSSPVATVPPLWRNGSGYVYVGQSDNTLRRLLSSTGALDSSLPVTAPLSGNMAFIAGQVAFGTEQGHMYVIKEAVSPMSVPAGYPYIAPGQRVRSVRALSFGGTWYFVFSTDGGVSYRIPLAP